MVKRQSECRKALENLMSSNARVGSSPIPSTNTNIAMKLHLCQSYSNNLDDYEDICSPRHESMRKSVDRHSKRAKYRRAYRIYDHYDRDFYRWLKRFIESSVGKDFNYIYNKIKEKFRYGPVNGSPLEKLESYVDMSETPCSNYTENYYFDSNSILRCRNKKYSTRPNSVTVNYGEPIAIRRLNKKTVLENSKVYNALLSILGWYKLNYLLEGNPIGREDMNRIESITRWRADWLPYYANTLAEFCTTREVIYPKQVFYPRGTKGFSRYYAEEKKRVRKFEREYKKQREEKNRCILYRIEAMKKEKEEQLNTVTRDRLGFNEESFIGEPYHGQKRKKK